jgi:3-(3-hydroxy-phenyl)propionate hydroxylase/6-hydroxy-3-succinoylpyridine 3-monooxygenase
VSNPCVVVVGAGAVGLVTALGLARAGIDVTVLEREPEPAAGPRDMIYHWCILPAFAELGVLDKMVEVGLANRGFTVKIPASGELLRIDMSALDGEVQHPFNLHVPQRAMADIITAQLATLPSVQVEWGVEVTDLAQDGGGVTVVAQDADGPRSYRADWVVGADGSRSIVRRQLGLGCAGTTWSQRFVSTDLRFDLGALGHASASYQVEPEFGAIIAKVDRAGLWRYTYAERRVLPEHSIPERLQAILERVLPAGADPLVQDTLPYRVHQRSAERFRVGRMLLVGDAAHLTNPTPAFGMLSGLFDAMSLIEALAAVAMLGADDEILDRYSAVRHRNFWDFTSPRSAEMMAFVFSAADPQRLEERLARYRRMETDRASAREFFLDYCGCQSSSLLDPASSAH